MIQKCKYSLNAIKELNTKESKRFKQLFEKFKDYDKIDILIELSKKRKLK